MKKILRKSWDLLEGHLKAHHQHTVVWEKANIMNKDGTNSHIAAS